VATVVENDCCSLRGDRVACEGFVREQYDGLFRWFLWLSNCPHRAADLTQETFAAFWGSLQRAAPETSPRTWLYSIGRNLWRKDCRSRRSHAAEGDESLEAMTDGEPSPAEAAEHREFAAALEGAVARVPADLAEVFTLRMWHEFDYAEIAALEGITPELARWRFFRARQIIRERLKAWS
jgi:RNA polymerase sigma-70 factor (ECF subfamily)